MAKTSQRLAKAPSTASEAASTVTQAATGQLRKAGPDRIQVQFVIDDLVERLIKDRIGPVMGCNGCNACN
jgi:hypothetical protein